MKAFFQGFKKGMHRFGGNIALIVNSFFLLIAYILGIGITSIISRMAGQSFLDMETGKKSYWKDLNLTKKEEEKYYRQF